MWASCDDASQVVFIFLVLTGVLVPSSWSFPLLVKQMSAALCLYLCRLIVWAQGDSNTQLIFEAEIPSALDPSKHSTFPWSSLSDQLFCRFSLAIHHSGSSLGSDLPESSFYIIKITFPRGENNWLIASTKGRSESFPIALYFISF